MIDPEDLPRRPWCPCPIVVCKRGILTDTQPDCISESCQRFQAYMEEKAIRRHLEAIAREIESWSR